MRARYPSSAAKKEQPHRELTALSQRTDCLAPASWQPYPSTARDISHGADWYPSASWLASLSRLTDVSQRAD